MCTLTMSEPLNRMNKGTVLWVEIRLLGSLLINKVSTGLGITPLSPNVTESYGDCGYAVLTPNLLLPTKCYIMPCKGVFFKKGE